MPPDVESQHSVLQKKSLWDRVSDWVVLEGDRRLVALGVVLLVSVIVWILISVGVLAVGPNSTAATLLGSGITSGVITLLTIALSVNQLIVSRIFDPLNSLSDRLDGAREVRTNVEELVDQNATPNDPAAFLSLIATEVAERSGKLLTLADTNQWQPAMEITDAIEDFEKYGTNIDENLETEMKVSDTLNVILGPEYAFNMTAVNYLQKKYGDALPAEAIEELQGIEEALEAIAVVRQFYKTVALQQDLAELSRLLVYSGLAALLYIIMLTLVFRTRSVTVPLEMLPALVTVGIGIFFLPLALFVSYILRAATIARETVSVGPFVPPE